MEISLGIVRLGLIALPGIAGYSVYRSLIGRSHKAPWEAFLEITLFSVLSYVVLGFGITIAQWFGLIVPNLTSFEILFDQQQHVNWPETGSATLIAVVISFIAAAASTHRVLHKVGRKLKATLRVGNDDTWTFFHEDYGENYVIVRDFAHDLAYYGLIEY